MTPDRETVAFGVQRAVRDGGGLERIVDAVWRGFEDPSVPGRRSSIMLGQRLAMDELGTTDPHTQRGESLRSSIEHASSELRELHRQNEATSRARASACVMRCMGGDPDSLKVLASLSLQVSSPFDAAVRACL